MEEKQRKFLTRTLSTLWMIAGFTFVLYMGHVYISGMILLIQVYMARELFNLARKNKQSSGSQWLDWHFFFTAVVFVYGRVLNKQLVTTLSSDKLLYQLFGFFIKYHVLICYSSYVVGVVCFTLSLKKGKYKYQFEQFAWTHMILLIVFTQSAFTVANLFEGIIWFLLPASLIIINDTAAYIFGVLMGRTPLIQLSPKKTLEGYIGALIFTIPSALLLAYWMRLSPWLTCPREDLSFGPLTCVPSPFFRSGSWPLHVLVYGLFASVIAPFGGFFASGLKRAFKIKDFGDSIPGHGGITDRMDCQMVMAVFSYIYYQSIISPLNESPANILDQALKTLTFEKQVELYKALGDMLYGRSHLCNATNPTSIYI